jgi:hypothetical protein
MRERENNFSMNYEDNGGFGGSAMQQNAELANIINPTTSKKTEDTSARDATIDAIKRQILGQNLTNKWSGQGRGSAEANAEDMAKILAGIGITDIKQFGKVPQYAPAREAYKTYNGQPVRDVFDEDTGATKRFIVEPDGGVDEEGYPTSRVVDVPKDAKLRSVYTVDVGLDETKEVDESKVKTVNGQVVADTGQTTFGNKETGQVVPNTYSERQTGNFFGGTFEGKGNTGYGVQFDNQGNPIFYTQGASSNDLANLMADLGPVFQIGMAIATGGLSIPQQIAANMALQVLSGQDMGDAIKNAAVSLAVAQIPGTDFMKEANKYIGKLDLPAGVTSTLNSSFQNAAMSGARALLTGQDVSDAMLKGAAAGGTSGAVSALMKQIPDFDKLTPTQQRMASNAVVGVISGKPLDQIAINAAIAAANAEIAEQKKYAPLSDEDISYLSPEQRKVYEESGSKGLTEFNRAQKTAAANQNADVTALQKSGLSTNDTANVVITGDNYYDDFLRSIGITNPTQLKDSGLSNDDIMRLINAPDDTVTVTGQKGTDGYTDAERQSKRIQDLIAVGGDPNENEILIRGKKIPSEAPVDNPVFQTPVKPNAPNLGNLGTVTVTADRLQKPDLNLSTDPVGLITNPLTPGQLPTTTPTTTPTPATPRINIDPVQALQEFYNPFKPAQSSAPPSQTDTGPIQLMTDVFGTNIATAQKTGARGYGFAAGGEIDELLRLLRS